MTDNKERTRKAIEASVRARKRNRQERLAQELRDAGWDVQPPDTDQTPADVA